MKNSRYDSRREKACPEVWVRSSGTSTPAAGRIAAATCRVSASTAEKTQGARGALTRDQGPGTRPGTRDQGPGPGTCDQGQGIKGPV